MATPSQLFLINKIIFKPKSSFAIEWETHWAEMRGPQWHLTKGKETSTFPSITMIIKCFYELRSRYITSNFIYKGILHSNFTWGKVEFLVHNNEKVYRWVTLTVTLQNHIYDISTYTIPHSVLSKSLDFFFIQESPPFFCFVSKSN